MIWFIKSTFTFLFFLCVSILSFNPIDLVLTTHAVYYNKTSAMISGKKIFLSDRYHLKTSPTEKRVSKNLFDFLTSHIINVIMVSSFVWHLFVKLDFLELYMLQLDTFQGWSWLMKLGWNMLPSPRCYNFGYTFFTILLNIT